MRHTHRGGGAWWMVILLLAATAWPGVAEAIERSINEVNGHISRELLGDGTGVIIAILDSGPSARGIVDTHPALTGTDSLGRPRLALALVA